MKVLFTLTAALILAGCGSTTNNQNSQVESNSNVQVAQNNNTPIVNTEGYKCDKEITTGSKFTKKRCRTAEQRKADEQEAREMLSTRGSAVSQVK